MTENGRPLITPITDQQRGAENRISKQIRDIEADVVRDILEKQPTPDGLVAVIENACGFAEQSTAKYRDPQTPPVACKEGCYWCCYQTVPVTPVEAFRISRFLEAEFDNGQKQQIIEKLHQLNKRTYGRTPRFREKMKVACAFLQDGRCIIYPVRPLACAEFTSFNVQDCKKAQRKGFKPDSIIHEKARMIVFRAVQQGLSEGLRTAMPHADAAPLELTAAVVCAISSPGAEASWINGNNIFSNAHLAGEGR